MQKTVQVVDDILLDGTEKSDIFGARHALKKPHNMRKTSVKIAAMEHQIDLTGDLLLIWQNAYRSGHKEREFSRNEIDKMLKAGLMQPYSSKWTSLVILSPKLDESIRF